MVLTAAIVLLPFASLQLCLYLAFGSDFTVYDSQLNSGENSVVLITNGASGSTYDIEYDVWKLRAASSPDTSG